jgi:hypothetical protein
MTGRKVCRDIWQYREGEEGKAGIAGRPDILRERAEKGRAAARAVVRA